MSEPEIQGQKILYDGKVVHEFPSHIQISEVRALHCSISGISISYKGYDQKTHKRVFGSINLTDCVQSVKSQDAKKSNASKWVPIKKTIF